MHAIVDGKIRGVYRFWGVSFNTPLEMLGSDGLIDNATHKVIKLSILRWRCLYKRWTKYIPQVLIFQYSVGDAYLVRALKPEEPYEPFNTPLEMLFVT